MNRKPEQQTVNPSIIFTMRMSRAMHTRLKEIAVAERRTLARQMEVILEKYLNEIPK